MKPTSITENGQVMDFKIPQATFRFVHDKKKRLFWITVTTKFHHALITIDGEVAPEDRYEVQIRRKYNLKKKRVKENG
jgi:hypothetical protein